MIPGAFGTEVLVTGKEFMAEIGAFFPVSMTVRGTAFEAVFMMRDGELGHRTTGPYTPDRPPVDAMNWARLRTGTAMAGHFPRFRIDASGLWPRIDVELLGTDVRGFIVMPEAVTAEAVNAPYLGAWQEQISSSVRIALDWLAGWIASCHHEAGGPEPSIDLDLVYRPDEDYETRLAGLDERVRELVPPVRTVLELRWRSATPAQRKAFAKYLKGARKTGPRSDRRLSLRIGDVTLEVVL
ncbi:hypothetical protein SAMN04489727_5174 [Amycolatopsis tolypomycina]|uniref:Uncharacterized protein n=1 Tax=Amycolatopsis tolypomycina TaxID=208445 RepID=A0A1H4VJ48_9PSEU|nr:ABC transporter substrate-binding protein [Amycolatopsis tolypomycina]SEC81037.1 hypothetical protein SAMN04489727_5174 [Amycolatopsis tolypomycina]